MTDTIPTVDRTLEGIKREVARQDHRDKDGNITFQQSIIRLTRSQVEALIEMAERP